MTGGERRHNASRSAIFKRVSRLKRSHRDVPLPVITVHGRFSQDVGCEILRGRIGRHDELTIRLAHSDIIDFQLLRGGGISEDELSKFLDSGAALNMNDGFGLFDSGPVVAKY